MTCPLSGTNDQILAGYFALLAASSLPRSKRSFDTVQESKHPYHLPCCTNDQILAGYFALLAASSLPRSRRSFDTVQESKHPYHLPCCANDQILPSILHCRPILTPAEQMISFDTGKRRSILHAHTVTQACNFPLDIPHRRPCPHSLETNEPLALARDTTPAYLPATQKDAVARIFCIASHAILPRSKQTFSAGKGYYPARPPMAQADTQGKTKAGPFAGTERVCWQPLFVHENASVQILRSERKRFVERTMLACVLR